MRSEVEGALRDVRGYADIRIRRIHVTTILFRGRALRVNLTTEAWGGSVRALAPGGGWATVGFAGIDRLSAQVARAFELSAAGRGGEALFPIPIRQHERPLSPDNDPTRVPVTEKRAWLEAATVELLGTDRRIVDARTSYREVVTETWFATTEGTWFADGRAEVAVASLAVAEEDGTVERAIESYAVPGAFAALATSAPIVRLAGVRAVERLHAAPARRGRFTLVLDPRAAGALIQATLAQRSVVAGAGEGPERLPLGTRVGPECLTVGDDPTAAGLRTTAVLDDEGTPAGKALLVQHGVVVGHLAARATARPTGHAPTGHAFASGLRDEPAARLTNTYLASGRGGGDLVGDVASGIYIADVLGVRLSGDQVSLEPGRSYVIRQGRLGEPVKCPPIAGSLWSLFGRLETVGDDFSWDSSDARGRSNGDGRPVTTGAPHARFVDVSIGEAVG
ncbi:MAG: TldD/PmbA family protein [Gemmatimonadota bacterium]